MDYIKRVEQLEKEKAELLAALKSQSNWLKQFSLYGTAIPVVRLGHLTRAKEIDKVIKRITTY